MLEKVEGSQIVKGSFDIDKYYKKYGIQKDKIQQKENQFSNKDSSPYKDLFEKYKISYVNQQPPSNSIKPVLQQKSDVENITKPKRVLTTQELIDQLSKKYLTNHDSQQINISNQMIQEQKQKVRKTRAEKLNLLQAKKPQKSNNFFKIKEKCMSSSSKKKKKESIEKVSGVFIKKLNFGRELSKLGKEIDEVELKILQKSKIKKSSKKVKIEKVEKIKIVKNVKKEKISEKKVKISKQPEKPKERKSAHKLKNKKKQRYPRVISTKTSAKKAKNLTKSVVVASKTAEKPRKQSFKRTKITKIKNCNNIEKKKVVDVLKEQQIKRREVDMAPRSRMKERLSFKRSDRLFTAKRRGKRRSTKGNSKSLMRISNKKEVKSLRKRGSKIRNYVKKQFEKLQTLKELVEEEEEVENRSSKKKEQKFQRLFQQKSDEKQQKVKKLRMEKGNIVKKKEISVIKNPEKKLKSASLQKVENKVNEVFICLEDEENEEIEQEQTKEVEKIQSQKSIKAPKKLQIHTKQENTTPKKKRKSKRNSLQVSSSKKSGLHCSQNDSSAQLQNYLNQEMPLSEISIDTPLQNERPALKPIEKDSLPDKSELLKSVKTQLFKKSKDDRSLFKKRMKKNTKRLYDNVVPLTKQKALSSLTCSEDDQNPYFIENHQKPKLTLKKTNSQTSSVKSVTSFMAMEEQIEQDISDMQDYKYIKIKPEKSDKFSPHRVKTSTGKPPLLRKKICNAKSIEELPSDQKKKVEGMRSSGKKSRRTKTTNVIKKIFIKKQKFDSSFEMDEIPQFEINSEILLNQKDFASELFRNVHKNKSTYNRPSTKQSRRSKGRSLDRNQGFKNRLSLKPKKSKKKYEDLPEQHFQTFQSEEIDQVDEFKQLPFSQKFPNTQDSQYYMKNDVQQMLQQRQFMQQQQQQGMNQQQLYMNNMNNMNNMNQQQFGHQLLINYCPITPQTNQLFSYQNNTNYVAPHLQQQMNRPNLENPQLMQLFNEFLQEKFGDNSNSKQEVKRQPKKVGSVYTRKQKLLSEQLRTNKRRNFTDYTDDDTSSIPIPRISPPKKNKIPQNHENRISNPSFVSSQIKENPEIEENKESTQILDQEKTQRTIPDISQQINIENLNQQPTQEVLSPTNKKS